MIAALGLVVGLLVPVIGASPAFADAPAAFTTTNSGVDGPGHCLNGNPNQTADPVNCNIYDGKKYVWLNGGPDGAQLPDGNYFFAVLDPGGQADPNDTGASNLSAQFDTYQDRTFSVSGGAVTYGGPHDFDSNKIRLAKYADTSNPGGEYILAICSLAKGYPVDPSTCKYDAFKAPPDVPPGAPLTVTKDAAGSYDNTYTWTITKSADKTIVKQIGGSATFIYTIVATPDGGTVSSVKVAGTITAYNPNIDSSNDTVPVSGVDVTDQLSDGTTCKVTDGHDVTLTQYSTAFAYSCDLAGLPQGELDNTATVSWGDQDLSDGASLSGGTADFTFSNVAFAENKVDECVNVSDSYAGSLGTACTPNATTFSYSRTIPVPTNDCQSYDNTATFTTNDTGATGSASQAVKVCGPAKTGALTMGFWKGPNGNGLIQGYCTTGSPTLATYLSSLGAGSGPFADAAGKNCGGLVTYVNNVLNKASATDMNKMLKAQMLATALDVYFSGPGWTSTKSGGVKPPSSFLSHNNLGTFNMDTTAICPMVDNLSTGTAACKNTTPSTDAVAAGAVPASPMAMQAILDYAATTPTPFNGSTSSSSWYGGNRTLEEILKNIYDQFNNQLAFGSF